VKHRLTDCLDARARCWVGVEVGTFGKEPIQARWGTDEASTAVLRNRPEEGVSPVELDEFTVVARLSHCFGEAAYTTDRCRRIAAAVEDQRLIVRIHAMAA
jgi:hypothetical protein